MEETDGLNDEGGRRGGRGRERDGGTQFFFFYFFHSFLVGNHTKEHVHREYLSDSFVAVAPRVCTRNPWTTSVRSTLPFPAVVTIRQMAGGKGGWITFDL